MMKEILKHERNIRNKVFNIVYKEDLLVLTIYS